MINTLWAFIATFFLFMFLMGSALRYSEKREKDLRNLVVSALNWSDHISPMEFERHCSDFLSLSGWKSSTTKASGDQGADIVASKKGITVVCQCKKYSKNVGNKAVQEAFAAKTFYEANAGAVITNSGYTRSALELAQKTGIYLFHFTDLLHFNSRVIPGDADIKVEELSCGEMEPESSYKVRQRILWALLALDAAVMFCIIMYAFLSISSSTP